MRESIIGGKKNIFNKAGTSLNKYSEFLTKARDKQAAKSKILGEVRENFRLFLAKREQGQPFYYSFNPTNTHRKWIQGSGKALWGLNPDDLKGRMPPVLPDVPLIREDMADYLGEVMAFDAACAELVRMLEEMGELDNTIVVISGDHGVPGFPRSKTNVHDFGSAVPLAIRWPGKIAASREVNAPVSLIDLAPTFLAAAGLERLGQSDVGHPLDENEWIPAAAQGVIAIECRADDAATTALLAAIDDPVTHAELDAERALLAALGGNCHSPVAALCVTTAGALAGVSAASSGSVRVRPWSLAAVPGPSVSSARGSALKSLVEPSAKVTSAVSSTPRVARERAGRQHTRTASREVRRPPSNRIRARATLEALLARA
jgi:hypothetical protein